MNKDPISVTMLGWLLAMQLACSDSSSRAAVYAGCHEPGCASQGQTVAQAGTDASSNEAGEAACGRIASGSKSCDACMTRSCCSEGVACTEQAECAALSNCLQACRDTACPAGCLAQYPRGVSAYRTLVRCTERACNAQCLVSIEGGAGCGELGALLTPCGTCASDHCCGEDRACSGDPQCASVLACSRACAPRDGNCLDACTTMNTNGTLYTILSQCLTANCASACGG